MTLFLVDYLNPYILPTTPPHFFFFFSSESSQGHAVPHNSSGTFCHRRSTRSARSNSPRIEGTTCIRRTYVHTTYVRAYTHTHKQTQTQTQTQTLTDTYIYIYIDIYRYNVPVLDCSGGEVL